MDPYIPISHATSVQKLGKNIFLLLVWSCLNHTVFLTLRLLKLELILLNLPAPFMTWCCLCCRLQRPDDNTSVPGVISLPGEHSLNQKGPVVLLSGNFSTVICGAFSHSGMWHMSHSFPKKMHSFIHLNANYCGLWVWLLFSTTGCCSVSIFSHLTFII